MFGTEVLQLRQAVDALELPSDGPGLASLIAVRDQLDAKITAAVAAFDADCLWDIDGATSTTSWLTDHGRSSRRDAARLVATARAVRDLPVTAEAWQTGRLSSGQVDAVVANVGRRAVPDFATAEAELVPALEALTTAETAVVMREWRAHHDATNEETEPAGDAGVSLSMVLDGRWRLDGNLDSLTGELVDTALQAAEPVRSDGIPMEGPKRRRAEALGTVCQYFLDHHTDTAASPNPNRPHLNVIVNLDDLDGGRGGRFVDGGHLDGAAVQALLCDSVLHRVIMAGKSTVLDYGTSTRTISPALRAALVIRDQHCRFPGCDRPARWCEGHHLQWVSEQGPTRLVNLALLCRRHHRLFHKPGWQAELDTDGTLHVTDPGGLTRTTRPPGLINQAA